MSSHGPFTPAPPDSLYSEIEPPFGALYARKRYSMLIEPAVHLNALVRDFQIAGGRILIREFQTLEEIAGVPERVIY